MAPWVSTASMSIALGVYGPVLQRGSGPLCGLPCTSLCGTVWTGVSPGIRKLGPPTQTGGPISKAGASHWVHRQAHQSPVSHTATSLLGKEKLRIHEDVRRTQAGTSHEAGHGPSGECPAGTRPRPLPTEPALQSDLVWGKTEVQGSGQSGAGSMGPHLTPSCEAARELPRGARTRHKSREAAESLSSHGHSSTRVREAENSPGTNHRGGGWAVPPSPGCSGLVGTSQSRGQ